MRAANLALRFALELAAIAALVAFGLSLDASVVVRVVVAVAAAAAFIAVWGRWRAPKSAQRLADPEGLVLELVLFAAATAALIAAGSAALAAIFAALVTINEVLLQVFAPEGDVRDLGPYRGSAGRPQPPAERIERVVVRVADVDRLLRRATAASSPAACPVKGRAPNSVSATPPPSLPGNQAATRASAVCRMPGR